VRGLITAFIKRGVERTNFSRFQCKRTEYDPVNWIFTTPSYSFRCPYVTICIFDIRRCIQIFRTDSITKYTRTIINTRWEAKQRVMSAKLTRLTHKIVIQRHLVAESSTICSSRSRRPVRKLLDTSYYVVNASYSSPPLSSGVGLVGLYQALVT